MFVQIIEGRTSDPEGLLRQMSAWDGDLRPGATGFLGSTSGVSADGVAVTIARFDSEAAARANSDRPEQGQWWAETEKYYDGPVAFTESSDTTEWLGGGADDAGFVQIMKMRGVDRSELEQMDVAFDDDKMRELRPDVLGGLRIWTAPNACTEVVYFASEEEARLGESKEMPTEVQEAMKPMQEADVEFIDLPQPRLT